MLKEFIEDRLQEKKLLMMTHVICGYPSFEDNYKELQIMEEAGVELVELQFPFSEPSADGPLFVKANQLSLENGTTVDDCLEFMARVSKDFSFKVLMMGYYNKPEETAKVMKEIDGETWFCTGDVGKLVKGPGGDDFLKITDRKKELLKTSGGKYVAPAPIENAFKEDFLIEQIEGGDLKPLGFLTGQVMKRSQGKANPKRVTELLRKSLLGE